MHRRFGSLHEVGGHTLLDFLLNLQQVKAKFLSRLIPVVRLFGQRSADAGLQLGWNVAQVGREGGGVFAQYLHEHRRRISSLERQRVGQQLIEHHAGGKNVGAGIDGHAS